MVLNCYNIEKYKTPTGAELHCRGWLQEAALRMLLNNLDSEVPEKPGDLIVYGGRGKVVRDFEALDNIIAALKELAHDESLLIQSGKPAGMLKTHKDAPRVLISNSQLVPGWATWQHFDELEKKGLIMYGQMTAGSWIYIGSQGIVQGTYETYAAIANRHFGGTLKGTLNVIAGLGGMGGAQPLAITMNEGVALVAEVEEWRIDKRLSTKYLDEKYTGIDEAIDRALIYKAEGKTVSIGVLCNAVHLLARLIERKIIPDTVTDQTSAHDPLIGYWPHQISYEQAKLLRDEEPQQYITYAYHSMYRHVDLMLQLMDKGSIVFDYGNNIRARVKEHLQMNPKLHTNQFSLSGGIKTGVQHNAVSVDHLEVMNDDAIEELSKSGTIGVMLPGAAFFLRTPYPRARDMIDAGCAVALASDYNPGSCPSGNMNLVVSMACIQMKMTPEEAVNAATINGAFALDVQNHLGSISIGKKASFIITKPVPSLAYFPYSFGSNLVERVYINSKPFPFQVPEVIDIAINEAPYE